MKKRFKLIMMLSCVFACLFFAYFASGGIRQIMQGRVQAVSGEVYSAKKEECSINEKIEQTDFQVKAYYHNEELPYDNENRTFMLFSDVEKSKIEYRASEGIELMYSDDWNTLLAYRGNQAVEYQFWEAAIPVIVIHSEGKEIGPEDYVDAELSIYEELNGTYKRNEMKVKLHTRGASSHWIEKRSYRIKFQSQEGVVGKRSSILGMDLANEWILYSFYGDESKMREKLGRDLWYGMARESSYAERKNGLQMEYCEVFLDNEYVGLYGIGTAIDYKILFPEKSKERLDLLFKTTNFTAPTLEQALEAGKAETCATLTLKYETWYSKERWRTIGEFMDLAYYGTDEEYAEKMKEYMYEENAIDYWLFMQASGLDDNELKNIYFSIEDALNNKQILFTPWDLDMSWGVEYTGEDIFMWGRNPERYKKIVEFPIISRMFEVKDQEFIDKLKERWRFLRTTIINEEKMLERIDKYDQILYKTGVIERDRKKWPEAPQADDLEYIKDYINKRFTFLDEYIEKL